MVLRPLEVMGERCESIWNYGLEKHIFMCHFVRSSEKQKAERHVGSRHPRPHEVSEGMRPLWPGLEIINACHFLARNLAAFCLCPENSNKIELKSNGLIW